MHSSIHPRNHLGKAIAVLAAAASASLLALSGPASAATASQEPPPASQLRGTDVTLTPSSAALVPGSDASAQLAAASGVGGQITRSEVLARARDWFSRTPRLKYNWSRAPNTLVRDADGAHRYGPDCSGFVSMAWHLIPGGSGGLNTQSLPRVSNSIPRSGLKPGDLLDDVNDRHAVLFEAWEADHAHFSYYSFGGGADGATPIEHITHGSFSKVRLSGHPTANYRAYRYNNIIDSPPVPPVPAPPVPPVPGKVWVDTFANAPGSSTPGGPQTGTLYAGTNYVYCKVRGPNVQHGTEYNHWWLLTDLDTGNPWRNQYVSAYYLSRWGNDVAKDNTGAVIRDC